MEITNIIEFIKKNKIPVIAVILALTSIIVAGIVIGRLLSVANKASLNQKDITSTTKSLSKLESEFYNQSQSFGPTGPPGKTGSSGPSGGLFSAQGQLINLANKKTADITQGVGVNSISYLTDPNKVTNQHWTLESTGLLRNKYSDKCITGNKDTNNIYMDNCNGINKSQEWHWDNLGNIRWWGVKPNMCLDYKKFNMNPQNTTAQIKNGTPQKKSASSTVNKLTLKQCNSLGSSPSQKWYIG